MPFYWRKSLLFRWASSYFGGYAAALAENPHFSHNWLKTLKVMFLVSRDNPAYYLTSVAHKRLPIFQKDSLKQIVSNAFDEARASGGFRIFAYVIMPDHVHLLTDNGREIRDVLRFINGISAKRVIDYLRINNNESSLAKLRIAERENKHKHSVYQHHPNAIRITGEEALIQKVNYIHFNPVRAGLVEHPDEYIFSSARQWNRRSFNTEPLVTEHRQIKWRPAT